MERIWAKLSSDGNGCNSIDLNGDVLVGTTAEFGLLSSVSGKDRVVIGLYYLLSEVIFSSVLAFNG